MGSFCLKTKKIYEEVEQISELNKLIDEEEKEVTNMCSKGRVLSNIIESKENLLSSQIESEFIAIKIKQNLTDLMYIYQVYEKDITEKKQDYNKYKNLILLYFIAKETNWEADVLLIVKLVCSEFL